MHSTLDIEAIRQIPLTDFLNHLGCRPMDTDHKGIWYLSPYRSERKPSFHVSPKKGVWYDFGTGEGGDIFTLAAKLIGNTDFMEQARYISEKMAMPPKEEFRMPKVKPFNDDPAFENVEVSELTSPALLKYLADRGISRNVARQYCYQIDYDLRGSSRSALEAERTKNHYYAIGFQNNGNGFELRSPFAKLCIPPKHISHIANGNARCNVFEGFMDFLSAEQLGWNDGNDSVILNSVANIGKALPTLADYHVILCYLDNDAAGQAALARLQKEFGGKVADKSTLYPNHKDVNDYLQSITPKHSTKIKL